MIKGTDKLFRIEAVQALLRKRIASEGSQAAWARKFGVKSDYVSHALSGSRLPTRSLLKALELRKVPAYESTVRAAVRD